MKKRIFTEQDARFLTALAMREGLISADEPCCVCGSTRSVIRHHPDLARRPLWTFPLCRADHGRVHAGIIPDPGTSIVTAVSERYAWGRSKAGLEAAVERALVEGRKPHGMPRDAWDRELDARGARERFEAKAAHRKTRKAAEAARWEARRAQRRADTAEA